MLLPYDFEAYEEVSKAMYQTFLKYTKLVQVLSCDEALLDLTDACDKNYETAMAIVVRIRQVRPSKNRTKHKSRTTTTEDQKKKTETLRVSKNKKLKKKEKKK